MVRKRLDERIRFLLERSVVTNQRSMLILVGDRGKDQVPNLHQILTKTMVNTMKRPKVLWCYKKELGFSTHRMKRLKKLKRDKARGLLDDNNTNVDNFELFISQTDINWCYYRDSHRILGSTVQMLILQDFEALTPNLMARTIETVAGGGLIIFLMHTVSSLKQLYVMSMDVHNRYRTDSSSGEVIPRFNERFILSLGQCSNCLICDDELNILPISRKSLKSLSTSSTTSTSKNNGGGGIVHVKGDNGEIIVQETLEEKQLYELQQSFIDTPHIGVLIELTKTFDQAKALLVFLDACSEKDNNTTSSNNKNNIGTRTIVSMTAARGRGKSATIGLCLAGAISLGYSSIAVTSPEPENCVALFEFIIRGLNALKYQEHTDYNVSYNNGKGRDNIKCILSIHIYKTHRQVIQYISPNEYDQFLSCEIVAIDEAAAIPLPIVKGLLNQKNTASDNRLTFLSSTINGYEGTGRALSLKLLKELREVKNKNRQKTIEMANDAIANTNIERNSTRKGDVKVHEQRWTAIANAISSSTSSSKDVDNYSGPLREIELIQPIRYSEGDVVEHWLNKLLCLDSTSNGFQLKNGIPIPNTCELYHVDRDALFSYHTLSESFLQKIMNLYTSAHYKNTPNDLQMLSDAPAHSLFVLLSSNAESNNNKNDKSSTTKDEPQLPDVLVVMQVAYEGKISRKVVEAQLSRGHRSAGDLIPWTISQQFNDSQFAQLSGVRIVRIAVHPSIQGMGYGTRAIELLYRFYNGELMTLHNDNEEEDDDDSNQESNKKDDNSSDDDDDDDEDNDDEENEEPKSPKKRIHEERLKPKKELPPLLLQLSEMKVPRLDWIGTSFGLTLQLHKFWSSAMMKMLYIRQTKNELTGEHSVIMLRTLPNRTSVDSDKWIQSFVHDTRRRFVTLLGSSSFRDMEIRQAVSVLDNLNIKTSSSSTVTEKIGQMLTAEELDYHMTPHDLKRLELYGRNLCDHHLISDLIPTIARLYFLGKFDTNLLTLSSVQSALICGIGLQQRTVDSLTKDLNIPASQVLAMFNKSIRKMSITLNTIVEENEKKSIYLSNEQRQLAEKKMEQLKDVTVKTLDEDVEDAADIAMAALRGEQEQQEGIELLPTEITEDRELMRYVVKGSDKQWKDALSTSNDDVVIDDKLNALGTIQIKSVREKRKAENDDDDKNNNDMEYNKKDNNKKNENSKFKKHHPEQQQKRGQHSSSNSKKKNTNQDNKKKHKKSR